MALELIAQEMRSMPRSDKVEVSMKLFAQSVPLKGWLKVLMRDVDPHAPIHTVIRRLGKPQRFDPIQRFSRIEYLRRFGVRRYCQQMLDIYRWRRLERDQICTALYRAVKYAGTG